MIWFILYMSRKMIRVIVCPSQYIAAVITQYQFALLITILILIASLKWTPLCYYTKQLLFFSLQLMFVMNYLNAVSYIFFQQTWSHLFNHLLILLVWISYCHHYCGIVIFFLLQELTYFCLFKYKKWINKHSHWNQE